MEAVFPLRSKLKESRTHGYQLLRVPVQKAKSPGLPIVAI